MPALRASLGYVGAVAFETGAFGKVFARATSCDVRTSQDITYPDVIDGRVDRTVYQLGPRIVQGNVAFPLIHEGAAVQSGRDCGQTANFGNIFWRLASERDPYGRLVNDSMNLHVRYTDNTAFTYPSCLINQLTISVVQSEPVNFSVDVLAGANSTDDVRRPADPTVFQNPNFLSPARIVTWNDFKIRIFGDNQSFNVLGDEIRSFECTLNNDAERYFTLNSKLAPQDITARKRKIEGNFRLMGRNVALSELAYTNDTRFTSTAAIAFGYKLGPSNAAPYWSTALMGVIFQIEEIALSNDIVETTVNYAALGDCDNNYEAIQLGTSPGTPTETYPSGTNYGGPTAPGFPGF